MKNRRNNIPFDLVREKSVLLQEIGCEMDATIETHRLGSGIPCRDVSEHERQYINYVVCIKVTHRRRVTTRLVDMYISKTYFTIHMVNRARTACHGVTRKEDIRVNSPLVSTSPTPKSLSVFG